MTLSHFQAKKKPLRLLSGSSFLRDRLSTMAATVAYELSVIGDESLNTPLVVVGHTPATLSNTCRPAWHLVFLRAVVVAGLADVTLSVSHRL